MDDAGSKHKKTLARRQSGHPLASKPPQTDTAKVVAQSIEGDILPRSIIRIVESKKSAGTFKCKSCDCVLNSESQLAQVRTDQTPTFLVCFHCLRAHACAWVCGLTKVEHRFGFS